MENVIASDLAEIKLSKKNKVRASDRPQVTNSKQAYSLFMKNWNLLLNHLVVCKDGFQSFVDGGLL